MQSQDNVPALKVPVHVGLIMDGNGRWANARGLPRIMGHREGLKAVRRTVEAASDMRLKYLTLYSFSWENWKRPREEVSFLLSLIEERLKAEADDLHEGNARVRFLGRRQELSRSLVSVMEWIESRTRGNTGLTLTFAVNYGGRQEILDAVTALLRRDASVPGAVDEDTLRKFLYAPDIPDPDLIIRTAGERRLSNFLLWQAAYAEFYSTPVLWPDFSGQDLVEALRDFHSRKRKFGGLG